MFATHGGPVQISDEERGYVCTYSGYLWMVLCIEESRDSLAFEYFASVEEEVGGTLWRGITWYGVRL